MKLDRYSLDIVHEDINLAERVSCQKCPVANALKKWALDNFKIDNLEVYAGMTFAWIREVNKENSFQNQYIEILYEGELLAAVEHYDRGGTFLPGKYSINVKEAGTKN